MKNFTLLSIFLGFFSGNAQTEQLQPSMIQTETNWTTTLQNLNTSSISSGVLYDKVTPLANLLTFNRLEFNSSDNDHFRQAISELYRASNNTKFVAPESLDYLPAQTPPIAFPNNSVPSVNVGIINTTFQKLNYNENTPSDGGLTYLNDAFYPISGKPSFLTKKVFIIAPLKDYVTGTSVNFKFNQSFIFTNTTSPLKTLSADFGNGQTAVIIQNSLIVTASVNVPYTSTGMKSIKFTAVFADNSSMETFGKFYFNLSPDTLAPSNKSISCSDPLKIKETFTSTIPFQGYEESSPVYGKIEYNIFFNYKNTAKKILKPIIIIDGFDPGDMRRVLDCDCEADPACSLEYDDDDNGIFNASKHKSIEDMMYYTIKDTVTGLPQTKNLIDELRNKDYDVIIINNPTYTTKNIAGATVTIDGGADYIERNAMNLVSYIQNVNSQLLANGSSENLDIVGPSMGGQISRYALAYMDKKFAETNNPIWKSNTRLWISVDSPHLGANIPLSTQLSVFWLGYRVGDQNAKKKYNKLINSIAARQQLVYQYNQIENTTSNNSLSLLTD